MTRNRPLSDRELAQGLDALRGIIRVSAAFTADFRSDVLTMLDAAIDRLRETALDASPMELLSRSDRIADKLREVGFRSTDDEGRDREREPIRKRPDSARLMMRSGLSVEQLAALLRRRVLDARLAGGVCVELHVDEVEDLIEFVDWVAAADRTIATLARSVYLLMPPHPGNGNEKDPDRERVCRACGSKIEKDLPDCVGSKLRDLWGRT